MKRVAVIILNWNGEALLRRFLPGVTAYTPQAIADVIVADNGSTDGSLALLAQEFPGVGVISFDENHGFAEGYNRAINAVAADYAYAVLLNSDVEIVDDWLTPLWRFMEDHDGVGALQPKILSQREPRRFEYAGAAGGFLDRNGYPYCRGRIFGDVEEDHGQYDGAPIDVHWASGAALMVRIDAYRAVGGLDPLFFAHMEEIDLCWRMRLAGWRVMALSDTAVRHVGGASLPQGNPRKVYLNFRNNLLMMWKNLPKRTRCATLLRRQVLDGIAALKFLVSGDVASVGAVLKAHRDYRRMRRKATESNAREDLLKGSPDILVSYYLKGRRRYGQL